MEYETGIRLDRIEYKVDLLLEAAGLTSKTKTEEGPKVKRKKKEIEDDL